MGQGIATDARDDLGTDDGSNIVTDSDLAAQFRNSLPENQRGEFDRLYVPKADLTRMRQKDTDRVRTLEERLSIIEQGGQRPQAPGNGSGVTDEIQGLLAKHGIDGDGNSAALHKMLLEYGQVLTQKAVNATIGQMSPFITGVTQDVQSRQLTQAKQTLINDLGKGVEKLWPEIEQTARAELNAGRAVDPEMLLKRMYPDHYHKLVASAYERKRRQDQTRSQSAGMEGMVSVTRNTVFPNTGGRETGDTGPKGIDPDRITAEVRREMGL